MDWENDEVCKEYLLKKMELSEGEINDDLIDRFVRDIELNFEPEED